MRRSTPHPDQFALTFGRDSEIERIIEARVAIRAEHQAIRWRFRLIIIETAVLSVMIAAAGYFLGQPLGKILSSALLVALGCLASGFLLVILSGGISMAMSRALRWKANRATTARWTRRS
jgi:hypothetical protein